MYYYVVFCVDPYDCMGHRAKILQFDNIKRAMEAYKNVFWDGDPFLEEIKELYCWDEETIEQAVEEGDALNASGCICLYKSELNISDIPNVDWYGSKSTPYGEWINDYDGLSDDPHGFISLIELVEYYDCDLICSYEFGLYSIEQDCLDYSMIYLECLDSIDEAKEQLLEEGYMEV